MTISRLPNGRWRARIWKDGKDVPVGQILNTGATSYPSQKAAKDAYAEARLALKEQREDHETTVREWWVRWTTQAVYRRPKESTNIRNRQTSRQFVDQYGDRPLSSIDKKVVGLWRESGKHEGTIPILRSMWNDAINQAGLVEKNPWAQLGIKQTRGNRDSVAPDQEMVWRLIGAARRLTPSGFAGWLQVAAFSGCRPAELDALRWENVEGSTARIVEQFSSVSRTFTLPKNGRQREAMLPGPAREALASLARESEFCFVNTQRTHWATASREYWWNKARRDVGYKGSLYLATRHHAGWYMINVLGLSAQEVAIALGHEDGGKLVELLYGHRDKKRTLERVVAAYDQRANVVPLLRLAEEA